MPKADKKAQIASLKKRIKEATAVHKAAQKAENFYARATDKANAVLVKLEDKLDDLDSQP